MAPPVSLAGARPLSYAAPLYEVIDSRMKHCVVIGGGREEPWWEAYTNCYTPTSWGDACEPVKVEHTYLHTVGLLDCCRDRGCWKNKVTSDEKDGKRSYCKRPVKAEGGQRVPECMNMITAAHVVGKSETVRLVGHGEHGLGAYHGFDGFKRFSHARGVTKVRIFNPTRLAMPPYGRLTGILAKIMGRG